MAKPETPKARGSVLTQGEKGKALVRGAMSIKLFPSLKTVTRQLKDGSLRQDAEKVGGDMRSAMNKERASRVYKS